MTDISEAAKAILPSKECADRAISIVSDDSMVMFDNHDHREYVIEFLERAKRKLPSEASIERDRIRKRTK